MVLCEGMSKLFIIGPVLQTIALVINFIGFASPYWIYAEIGNAKVYFGLWKQCETISISDEDNTRCDDAPPHADMPRAVQVFACLGFACLLIAVLALAIKIRLNKASFLYLSAGLSFAGALCILISIAVFADKFTNSDVPDHFHFAFAFCIIAMILAIPAGVLLIIAGSK